MQLIALANNLADFLQRLALPTDVQHWSLTTLRETLVKIGANVTRHAKYVTFQLAKVAVPHRLFAAILDCIAWHALPPSLVAYRDSGSEQRVENEVPGGEGLRETNHSAAKKRLDGDRFEDSSS